MARYLAAVAVLCLSLLSSFANADLRSDLRNPRLSINVVIENALNRGSTPVEIATRALRLAPDESITIVAALILAAPDAAVTIIEVALKAGVSPLELAPTAVFAAPSRSLPAILNLLLKGADAATQESIIAAALEAAPRSRRDAIVEIKEGLLVASRAGVLLPSVYDEVSDHGGFTLTRRLVEDFIAAVQAVVDAQAALDAALLSGDPVAIADAETALAIAQALVAASSEAERWLLSPN